MFHFVSARLSLSYLLLCTLGCVGVLQIQAARHRLVGLSLWGGRGSRRRSVVFGVALVVASFAGFYGFTPGIFIPGPAGSELVVLFGSGLVLGLAISLTVAALAVPPRRWDTRKVCGEQVVMVSDRRGRLCLPGSSGPSPALCFVPEPGGPYDTAEILVLRLIARGFATLIVDWIAEDGKNAAIRYPDVLALVPAAMECLHARSEVDGERIGVLGLGLGADLVLRAAGADEQVAAAVAVGPLLTAGSSGTGLDLLRCGSAYEAIRKRHDRRVQTTLSRALGAQEFAPLIAPRPVLVLDANPSRWPVPSPGMDVLPLGGEVDFDREALAELVVRWCQEHL